MRHLVTVAYKNEVMSETTQMETFRKSQTTSKVENKVKFK